MKLHADTKFAMVAVIAFMLVAVLLPMSMAVTGCQMASMSGGMMPISFGAAFNSVCTMVQDPSIPAAIDGPTLSLLIVVIAALAFAVASVVRPQLSVARSLVPVAASPPPEPPEPPLGESLRL